MKTFLKRLLKQCGYEIAPFGTREQLEGYPPDLTSEERAIFEAVTPFTMTSLERVIVLLQATRYIVENRIPGDFVECGVWRGGSMMAVARCLIHLGETARQLYLYDTFAGMSPPTAKDRRFDGATAYQLLEEDERNTGIWCYADEADVMRNLLSTGYPPNNIHLIKGEVEKTIPGITPELICLLRLDTDWYSSTMHELTYLYPKLVKHGVLIIDDYGHWQGARVATDEYFGRADVKPFLQRIDYTGRATVKS